MRLRIVGRRNGRFGGCPFANLKNVDRLRDVLDPLWAEVPEAEIEFVLDAVKDDAGNARPARLRHLLQTRRNVHAVAVNVIPIDDDVAEFIPIRNSNRCSSARSALRSAIAL